MNLGRFRGRSLLTGAGFTKNWDGHLASEIWELLVSTPVVRSGKALRTAFAGNVGFFEDALDQVRAHATNHEARQLEDEVVRVFLDQQEVITSALKQAPKTNLEEFLSFFGKGRQDLGNLLGDADSGYIFTLNQDLLVETASLNDHIFDPPLVPGVAGQTTESRLSRRSFRPRNNLRHLQETRAVSNGTDLQLAGRLNYIKLHGSYEWRSSGAAKVLVVGGGKQSTLNAFPLLAAYLDAFRSVCSHPNLQLMVIGYSFRDPHINEVIAKGVRDNGLTIFLIDPTTPSDSLSRLRSENNCDLETIADAIAGWSTKPLSDTLAGPSRSPEYRRILRVFFGLELP